MVGGMARYKRKEKEPEYKIPDDLLAMSLEELEAEDDARADREEFARLVAARDKAQQAIDAYRQRGRDLTEAILAKYKLKKEQGG